MTRRQPPLPPGDWDAPLEARESRRLPLDRVVEIVIMSLMAFLASMGGLVTAGAYIFLTQKEAMVMRSDQAAISTRVSVLEAKYGERASISSDTPSRTASMYPGHHR